MILLVLLVGGIGLWQMYAVGQVVNDALRAEQQRAWSLEMLSAGHELVAALDHMVLTEDPTLASEELPVAMGQLDFYLESLQESLEGYSYYLEGLKVTQGVLRRAMEEIDVLARQERWAEASATLEQQVRPAHDQVGYLTRHLVQQIEENSESEALRVRAVIRRTAILMVVLVVFTVAVALGWRQIVFRQVVLSIAELRRGVARITGGDLEHELDIRTGDEIEELGSEFNKMAARLADLIGGLEQRVAERTRDLERRAVQLEAAAEVARDAAAIRDVGQLLDETVHLIFDQFGFYHAGIFLVDGAREYAVLRAASSEGGRRMLARGHKLKVGEVGIVGYAAGSGEPRVALDVGEDAVFFDNPDLPRTRSEMAVPLEVRGEVIGVLDVQSTEAAAFSDEDVEILQTMADQVALAIENARLLEESQRALRELETAYGRRAREAWQERAARQPTAAYRYTRVGVESASEMLSASFLIEKGSEAAPATQREAVVVQGQEGDGRRLAAPIRLCGQNIGSIVLRRDPEEEPWSQEEAVLMEEVSGQIALALENARLLEETRRRAAQEHTIRDITGKVTGAFDVQTILKTTVEELSQVLGVSDACIELGPIPDATSGYQAASAVPSEEEM